MPGNGWIGVTSPVEPGKCAVLWIVCFFKYVNITAGPYGFKYTHNAMYRGIMWRHVVAYGSQWVHVIHVWPLAHPARVVVALPTAKRQGHCLYRPATVKGGRAVMLHRLEALYRWNGYAGQIVK